MFLDIILGNAVTRKVERKKKVEGQIEVLKKQQKVKFESTNNDFDKKEAETNANASNQIANLKNQIKIIENSRDARIEVLKEERKVVLDKVLNEFNGKIVAKRNQSKKLGYLIEAERKNIQDVVESDTPNAPSVTRNNIEVRTDDTKKDARNKKILNEKKSN